MMNEFALLVMELTACVGLTLTFVVPLMLMAGDDHE